MREYLTDSNCEKLRYQPCTTTIISKLANLPKSNEGRKTVGFNLALDRVDSRFGDNGTLNTVLISLLKLAVNLMAEGYGIAVLSHVDGDEALYNFFCKYGVPCEHIDLRPANGDSCLNALKYYSNFELVVGMRGHAQMIPFGCRVPIVSIVSHEKMRYFLEDIKHPEWGIDVHEENFQDKLLEKARFALNNKESIINEIDLLQNKLYDITKQNILDIYNGN